MIYWDIIKTLVGPAVALLVAFVGWVLTDRYNATQLKITKQRNDAEVEVTRINAALRYIELIGNLHNDDISGRRQAVAVAAPVLPPEIAFQLAAAQLPNDRTALDTLMAKYQDGANKYLTATLEVPFRELRQTVSPGSPARYAEGQRTSEKRATDLFRYLRTKGHAERLFDFIVSQDYRNDRFRPIAVLFYFDNYRTFLVSGVGQATGGAYPKVRMEYEIKSLMSDTTLSVAAKQAIAFSASIVFGDRQDGGGDVFSSYAGEYFWHGFDVAHGGTPHEGTIQSHIYSNITLVDRLVKLASANLRDRVLKLDFDRLDIDNISLILYAYAQSPTVTRSSSYLIPVDVVDVVRAVLEWADTAQKRQELSMVFGSLGTEHLFRNLLPDCLGCAKDMATEEITARCAAARNFGGMLADWYRQYHSDDWYIPKFFHSVLVAVPDLGDRIDRKTWGFGWSPKSTSRSDCGKHEVSTGARPSTRR